MAEPSRQPFPPSSETLNESFGTTSLRPTRIWVEAADHRRGRRAHIPPARKKTRQHEENFAYTFDLALDGPQVTGRRAHSMLRRFLDSPECAKMFTAWAAGLDVRRSETIRRVA